MAETEDPTSAALDNAAGSVYSIAGKQFRALGSYDQAVAQSSDNPLLIYNRVSARRFVGDLDGAELNYEPVVELRPADFEAYIRSAFTDSRPKSHCRTRNLDLPWPREKTHIAMRRNSCSCGLAYCPEANRSQ